MRSVVLLGASGFLGPALATALGPALLARTYSAHPIEGGEHFDARVTPVAELMARLPARPDAAVVMLGVTNIDACARDPGGSAEVNVHGVTRVIGELAALGVMPVFLSSDGVFDGTKANWSEHDEARPILTYGRQKVEVERFVQRLAPPWAIVRLPKLLSLVPDARCMLTQWLNALGGQDTILCANDQFFTPAATVDAAGALAIMVRKGAQGLYHVGGPERLSRRALLQSVLDEYRQFARTRARIVECSLREVPVAEARPLDTSLSSKRFERQYGAQLRPASLVARAAVRAYFNSGQESAARS